MSGARIIWDEAQERGMAKWNRGQAEHGGDLMRKPTLNEAIDEALDQVSYLLVLRRQVDLAKMHLGEALETGSRESIQKAANLLHYGNAEGV